MQSPVAVNIDPILATCYYGDYDWQVAVPGGVFLVWADARNVQNGTNNPDVFFACLSEGPTITVPPNVTVETCADSGVVNVGTATASDACNAATVSGAVITKNGVPITPIPVVNGQVTLGPGTYTIRWTATAGSTQTTADQTVVVEPGIVALANFKVDDRARVVSAVINNGNGSTEIGVTAAAGSVTSIAPVRLDDRSTVTGTVTSAGSITVGNGVNTGTRTPNASLTPVPIPNITFNFPPPTGNDIFVNSGQTIPLAPGSYKNVSVNSGGRLVLSLGDYFFQSLNVNSASAAVVVVAGTRVFVQNSMVNNGSFITSGGQVASLFVGLAGTSQVTLNAPFAGTLFAPHATLAMGADSVLSFTGSFFAQNIEVRPGVQLTCAPGPF